MDLVVIAQIITGTATLIVAFVLLYQLRLQHKDSEINLSMQAVSNRQENRRWFMSQLDESFYNKLDLGLSTLSNYELEIFRSFITSQSVMQLNEWRLGRHSRNPKYYKQTFEALFFKKAGLEYYKKYGRYFFVTRNRADAKLVKYADEVYENLSGQKIED
tara:strand:- start:85 stop:564 length:480 start_codon:yes stop_codon:yes gene_type:complete